MTTSPDAEATKARIIKHMNQDHQDSLVRYLEHYCHVPSHLARNARLTSLTLSSLQLSTSASTKDTHLIPLDPPLDSWAQIRERVVTMDKTARAALGRSDITIKQYTRPRGVGMLVFIVSFLTFAVFARRANLAPNDPGSLLGQLAGKFPRVFGFLWKIQPYVFLPMVAGHSAQVWWLDRTRLQKHSVPKLSGLWWKWTVSHFVEGVTSFKRFDAMVEEERVKKEKLKH